MKNSQAILRSCPTLSFGRYWTFIVIGFGNRSLHVERKNIFYLKATLSNETAGHEGGITAIRTGGDGLGNI